MPMPARKDKVARPKFSRDERPRLETTPLDEGTLTCLSLGEAEMRAQKGPLRLDLTNRKLGVVPGGVCELAALHELSLVGNGIAELPDDLARCSSLRVLALGANRLETLPACVGQLQSLLHLGLSCNKIADEGLAALIEVLPRGLTSLDLSSNRMCRTQPTLAALAPLERLTHLHLDANPLCIGSDYPASVASSYLGGRLSLLDGAALPPLAEAAEPPAEPSAELLLSFELTKLTGMPPPPLPAAAAPAAAPPSDKKGKEAAEKAAGEAEEAARSRRVAFELSMPGDEEPSRAEPGRCDYESGEISGAPQLFELRVSRTAALRDALEVGGVQVTAYTIEDDAEADAEPDAPPAERRTQLGTFNATWPHIVRGSATWTHECRAKLSKAQRRPGSAKKESERPQLLALSVKCSVGVAPPEDDAAAETGA